MTSVERLYATLSATKYVVNNRIPGAFVEWGVWRGGNSMVIASTLYAMGIVDREIYLYDTFEAMTAPTELDLDSFGESAESQLKVSKKEDGSSIWCVAGIEDVQSNLSAVGYPTQRVHYVKGDVRETLAIEQNLPQTIALLRLDTDWYESTKLELEVLYPRLASKGVVLIDDYGHWQGARKAVDEYHAEHKLFPLMHVTDYTGRAFVKL
jgi:O-methyltransferase